jgi:16S rRNA (uracil1498-N3)-methyltransferase
MAAERPAPRLYVDADLTAGNEIVLSPAQSHYLGAVMRRGAGDGLHLFNGRHGEWQAEITALKRKIGAARPVTRTRPQTTEPDLWLLFAPVKRAPVDLMARMATELGVSALWPVITHNTVARRVKLERLRANAMEAAEQCGRLSLPEVFEPAPLDKVLDQWPGDRRLLLCDESGGGTPLAGALNGAEPGPWAVIIGPEGGFAPGEAEALAALPGALRAGLGPRILRAETAVAAALACWQALVGDWR